MHKDVVIQTLTVALLFCSVITGLLGYATGVEQSQKKAIAAGVAEWKFETDPKTGNVKKTFVFKSPVESP